MLNNPEFTKEEMEQESNPMELCTFSLGNLQLLSNVLLSESSSNDHDPFEMYDGHSIYALHQIAENSIKTIKTLAELTRKRIESISMEKNALEKKLEMYQGKGKDTHIEDGGIK